MIGTLVDVFEITGRGCVALVDIESGEWRVGDSLVVGGSEWPITGTDIPRYGPDMIDRMKQGWKPPVAFLLRGASKSDLSQAIGQQCRTADQAK